MARPRQQHPTDGELEILRILWQSGPSELGRICSAIRRRRPVATTTVATMLAVMLEKGLVKRAQGPRGYLWSARATQRATASQVLRKLIDHVFEGSGQRLVAHLLQEGKLSEADREKIREMLDADHGQTRP